MQLKFITLVIGTSILISTNLLAVKSEDNSARPSAKESSGDFFLVAPLKQFEETTEEFKKIEEEVPHHHKHHGGGSSSSSHNSKQEK